MASAGELAACVISPGRTQESVCAMASFSVDSYAATSRTGNSAVASLSTSDGDALVFTGGIAKIPNSSSSTEILAPTPRRMVEDFSCNSGNANALLSSVKTPQIRPPNLRKPGIGLWLRPMDTAPPRLRRAYFECRHGQLHVHNAIPVGGGFDELTTLICLHGAAGTGRMFLEVSKQLGSSRSIYSPDLPGCGESDASTTRLSIGGFADAIADFLDSMRFRQVDLLGVGAGAAVAVELALEPPLPPAPLVQLVEDHEGLPARPAGRLDLPAILTVVPAEVGAFTPAFEHATGESGLADLARAREKDHLVRQVLADQGLQRPGLHDGGLCLKAELGATFSASKHK